MSRKTIAQRIHTILASRKTRELGIYAFFVLLSAAAWFLQVLHENYDVDITVQLTLDDVPEDVVITDSLPTELLVKVNERGTTLMSYYLGGHSQPIVLSFADYNTSRPIGNVRIATSDMQKRIQAVFPASTSITRVYSDTVSFAYNRGISRRLPVRIDGTVSAQQHMYVHSIAMSPDSVTVYAPVSVLDTMTSAPTAPVKREDLRSDTRFVARMIAPAGMKCIPDTVAVAVHIDSYTEKTVEVPITGVNFPAGKQLQTFPGKVSVTFRIGMEHYNEVTGDQFAITVSYEDLIRTNRCRLRLKSTPDGVSNARLSQNEVDFLIEQTTE